jgi:hypothetical protein
MLGSRCKATSAYVSGAASSVWSTYRFPSFFRSTTGRLGLCTNRAGVLHQGSGLYSCGVFFCSLERITLSGRALSQASASASLPALSATIPSGPGFSPLPAFFPVSPGPYTLARPTEAELEDLRTFEEHAQQYGWTDEPEWVPRIREWAREAIKQ